MPRTLPTIPLRLTPMELDTIKQARVPPKSWRFKTRQRIAFKARIALEKFKKENPYEQSPNHKA